METAVQLLSPKQVARAIGVSESSLKRWCDRGLIRTIRTAGGHRKMLIGEVLAFVRDGNHTLVSPELLGLPPASDHADRGLVRGRKRLADSLLAGNELVARQIVFDLFLARHPLSQIFDEVIAVAFQVIGEQWECRKCEVFQERRACGIALRILHELRMTQIPAAGNWLAMGGTCEGDNYTLATTMAELVLRDAGYTATSLGSSIPFASMSGAILESRPAIFWLSVSHIRDTPEFVAGFETLSVSCGRSGSALVVGGRALNRELRQKMRYAAHCDTMQQLELFATTLSAGKRPKGGAPKP